MKIVFHLYYVKEEETYQLILSKPTHFYVWEDISPKRKIRKFKESVQSEEKVRK